MYGTAMMGLLGGGGSGNLFASTSYVGNGSTQSIVTGQNLTSGALTWIRKLNGIQQRGVLVTDTVRGSNKIFITNGNDAEVTASNGVTAFNGNGVSIGNEIYVNESAANYAIFSWLKQAGYMDIVTYTGNSNNRAISHNLGVAPSLMLFRNRSDISKGITYHGALGATKFLSLNLTTAQTTNAQQFQNTTPSSSVFTLGTSGDVNANTNNYVAWLFAEKAGKSKFGSYVGNGTTQSISAGFTPKAGLFKSTSVPEDWYLFYKEGSETYAVIPNLSAFRTTFTGVVDLVSGGANINTGNAYINSNGQTYIYSFWG
jgi:hypothetical protein